MRAVPADLDAAVRFYVDVLAFDVDRDERSGPSPYVALRRGVARVGLAQRDDVVKAGQRRPTTGVELVLEVADVTSARDRVAAAGWPIEENLTPRPWGLVDFRLLDPAGYYWRVTSSA